ncbi:MAG: PIG-L family deacetylase [Clostridia bacterium]|jgi:LmbE family N-acetylglucosaminyl deacetylase|nr:PIG-L family deacetylase [Clostridia bacterium]
MNNPIAVIVAHPDDEVLGCGGTICRLAHEGHKIHILILADGESSRIIADKSSISNQINIRNKAAEKACRIMGCDSVTIKNLPDNRLDRIERLDIIKIIESFIRDHQPTTLFTHHFGDVNIDHRITHDSVIAASRPQPNFPVKEILFFEVPSSTEWRPSGSLETFIPNMFVDISQTLSVKIDAINAYASELRFFPHPRSLEAIEALAKWRGATVGVTAAEAFVLGRKII